MYVSRRYSLAKNPDGDGWLTLRRLRNGRCVAEGVIGLSAIASVLCTENGKVKVSDLARPEAYVDRELDFIAAEVLRPV